MNHLLNKAQKQHQEISQAVALLSNAEKAVADDMTGEDITLALIAGLPDCESSAEVAELLFGALCNLMPAPAWNEIEESLIRLRVFAALLAPHLAGKPKANIVTSSLSTAHHV